MNNYYYRIDNGKIIVGGISGLRIYRETGKLTYDKNDVFDELKYAVFTKGKKIKDHDPDYYRRDIYGNIIYYHSYGKSSKMGWEVDHIVP